MIDNKLDQLEKSKFRSKMKLKEKDFEYIKSKGLDVIESHALDFISKRLKEKTEKDGKQTPYKGHPVFIAQHGTGTCCRECLYKCEILEEEDIKYIVSIIMGWINRQIKQ